MVSLSRHITNRLVAIWIEREERKGDPRMVIWRKKTVADENLSDNNVGSRVGSRVGSSIV